MATKTKSLEITQEAHPEISDSASQVRDLILASNQAEADLAAGRSALLSLVEYLWLEGYEKGDPFTTARVHTTTVVEQDGDINTVEDGNHVLVQFKVKSLSFDAHDPQVLQIHQALGDNAFGSLFEHFEEVVAVTDVGKFLASLQGIPASSFKVAGGKFTVTPGDLVQLQGVLSVDKVRGRDGFLDAVSKLPDSLKAAARSEILAYLRQALNNAVSLSNAARVNAPATP